MSFSSPTFFYSALSWDGEYFLIARAILYNNPTIYKIDYAGNVIETFTSSFGETISEMVWVPGHDGGNLWTVQSQFGDVRRLLVSELLPAPGGPVIPIRKALPVYLNKSERS